jgi:hypothetical protein
MRNWDFIMLYLQPACLSTGASGRVSVPVRDFLADFLTGQKCAHLPEEFWWLANRGHLTLFLVHACSQKFNFF